MTQKQGGEEEAMRERCSLTATPTYTHIYAHEMI